MKGRRSSRSRSPRAGGQRMRCFNSGMEVWLYDDAHLAALRASGAIDALRDDDTPARFEKLARPLIRKGMLAAYQMQGDGGVEPEVHVGEPLSAGELAVARWLEPQHAFLSLPSGTLCVESNDCLRLGSETPSDRGALARIPPGDYRLTLYRADDFQCEADGVKYRGPREIIVLTPGARAKPVAGQPAILPFTVAAPKTAGFSVAPGAYTGEAYVDEWNASVMLNLDREAAGRIGITDRSVLQVECPDMGLATTVIYLECTEKDLASVAFFERAGKLKPPNSRPQDEWAYGYFQRSEAVGNQLVLFCMRQDATDVPKKKRRKWLPATARLVT